MTQMYPGEAIYLRSANFVPQLNATRNMINSSQRGIALDTHGEARLMGNQIIFNATGGLVKLSATGTYIESVVGNYISSNGYAPVRCLTKCRRRARCAKAERREQLTLASDGDVRSVARRRSSMLAD